MYLSSAALAGGSSAGSGYDSEPSPDPGYPRQRRSRVLPPRATAFSAHTAAPGPYSPMLRTYTEVMVLIDRGGLDGQQTFAEAVATAADVVASVPVPAGGQGVGGGGGPPSCCRCVGVIVANDRAGHELFPMAPPKNAREGRRAPFPVVMVSQESGRLLKGALSAAAATAAATDSAPPWRGEECGAQIAPPGGAARGASYCWPGGGEMSMPPTVSRGENGADGVFVSLGATETSPAFNSRASCASSSSFEEEENSCDYYSTEEEEEEGGGGYADCSWRGGGGAWSATLRGAAWGKFDGCGLTHPTLGAFGDWTHPYGAWQRDAKAEVERGFETREWKRERMLYDAQTLPVRFQRRSS